MTRLNKSLGIITPFSFIEVGGKKVTGVIREQRIDTNNHVACQVTKNHFVGQRQ
ncbi:hypothetical protein D3C84_1113530 [compost metagenome]